MRRFGESHASLAGGWVEPASVQADAPRFDGHRAPVIPIVARCIVREDTQLPKSEKRCVQA